MTNGVTTYFHHSQDSSIYRALATDILRQTRSGIAWNGLASDTYSLDRSCKVPSVCRNGQASLGVAIGRDVGGIAWETMVYSPAASSAWIEEQRPLHW